MLSEKRLNGLKVQKTRHSYFWGDRHELSNSLLTYIGTLSEDSIKFVKKHTEDRTNQRWPGWPCHPRLPSGDGGETYR